MSQRSWSPACLRDGSDTVPLLSVSHTFLGARPFLDLQCLGACRPDGEPALALAHLNVFARQFQFPRQSIEHAIVGDISIPGDFSLLGGEALPGKVGRQG